METKEILQNIITDFDLQRLKRFFSEKNSKFRPSEENFDFYNTDNFSDGLKLGELALDDGVLLVCAFKAKQELSERSGKKAQYELGKKILKETQSDAGIFIYYNQAGNFRFSLIYANYYGNRRDWNNFRRFTYFISKEFTNKTFLARISGGDFSSLEKVKEAFAIGPVTDIFYKEFFVEYDKLVGAVESENKISNEKARDFVLLFAIRTVFLGFIQKRKWLGNDDKFIQKFYQFYKQSKSENKFYKEWLSILFFEALNKKFSPRKYLPESIKNALFSAPYLNGGLFREKSGYDDQGWIIPDKEIESFFDFLFAHSFTIEESSLDDADLQLNPEFLGIIFERLVNKADGAIYTPRTEVDFMCRLSLVKWLAKNLELPISKVNLYELFFREGATDEDQKDGSFSEKEAREIIAKLESLAICDPAAGSGAFLVGMMQVLDEVEQKLKEKFQFNEQNVFERKKQIIAKSLYGVEVKEWAVWIAQLRLWLSLFVEAPEEMKNYLEPILPSLDFKIRKGDSLVQRIGSKTFPIKGHLTIQSISIKKKITELKKFKVSYFENDKNTLVKGFDNPYKRELYIFEEILNLEIEEKRRSLRSLKNIKPVRNINLFGEKEITQPTLEFNKEKIETLEKEIKELEEQKTFIRKEKPLVWNIEFAEIFAEKGGFDIIIGNPPYVRQEGIADPTGKIKDKKEYKNYLAEMAKLDFPDDFPPKMKINAQSDLYVYFYIRGLRLLNPQGIHTFICSNSWLDVGYGAWLQNFLLKRCEVEFIIDNHAKRSFDAADVNTIISVIGAPQKKINENHKTRFVAFKKPFDEAIFTENLLQIENAKQVEGNEIFRVYPITSKNLQENGTEYESEAQKQLGAGKYIGDKWGGKYLRAPDFIFNYFVSRSIKIVLLQTVYKYIQRNNLSVIHNQKKFENNGKFFPFLSSIKDVKNIRVKISDLKFGITANSKEINTMVFPDIISNRFISDRMFFLEGDKFAVSDTFFILKLKDDYDKRFICALLNSSFSLLLTEIIGRKNLGGGLLTFYGYELARMYIVNPKIFSNAASTNLLEFYDKIKVRPIKSIFEECGIDPKSKTPIEEQNPKPLPDRAELDKIVFDALGLSKSERQEVYRAVCRLVWNRISKAKSV